MVLVFLDDGRTFRDFYSTDDLVAGILETIIPKNRVHIYALPKFCVYILGAIYKDVRYMIEYIKGEIVELTPARMILECAGIGYELNISLNTYTFYNGKPTGKIYVYEVIREDAHCFWICRKR